VEGVAEIHRKKLVHRDIKLENISLSPSCGLVRADFGLVFFTEDERTCRMSQYPNGAGVDSKGVAESVAVNHDRSCQDYWQNPMFLPQLVA
jgi:serine/threonine protein kinase